MDMFINLYCNNLDRMHAWKLLQHDAHSIIVQHGLSIAPHELILGRWQYTPPEMISDPQPEPVMHISRSWGTNLTVVDRPRDPGYAGGFQWDSGTHTDTDTEGMDPTVYVFSNDDNTNTRNSGALGLVKLRTSFEFEPQWLDDPTWYDWEGQSSYRATTCEVQDSVRLLSTEK